MSAVKILDLSDEATKINIGGYLVPRLYVIVVVIGETIYELPSESFKKLLTRLQRGDVFT